MSNDSNPFNILSTGESVSTTSDSGDATQRIKELISKSDIFLFMKGEPDFPQCGFSANVIQILRMMGASFKTFDILSDMELRQAIKEYSNWPTYPQLYFKGQLVGGNDIITEMYQSGDLQKVLSGQNA